MGRAVGVNSIFLIRGIPFGIFTMAGVSPRLTKKEQIIIKFHSFIGMRWNEINEEWEEEAKEEEAEEENYPLVPPPAPPFGRHFVYAPLLFCSSSSLFLFPSLLKTIRTELLSLSFSFHSSLVTLWQHSFTSPRSSFILSFRQSCSHAIPPSTH